MKFFCWLGQSNILKSLEFTHILENIKFRYVSWNCFDKDSVCIRVKRVKRRSIDIDFRANIDINSLEINRNPLISIGCAYISQLLKLIISLITNKSQLILIYLKNYEIFNREINIAIEPSGEQIHKLLRILNNSLFSFPLNRIKYFRIVSFLEPCIILTIYAILTLCSR